MFASSPISTLASVTTSAMAVCKRTANSEKRRTLSVSGRNRWSSYELVGAAGLSLVAGQAAVDDEGRRPTVETTPVENRLSFSEIGSAETVSVNPVHDLDTLPETPSKLVLDSLPTNDSTPKERHRSHDEILG